MENKRRLINTGLAIAISCFFLTAIANACESTEMEKTADGFIKKIVAGSDKINAYKTTMGKEEVYKLELLAPYFVMCSEGEYYKITDVPADTIDEANSGNVGYVKKEQSHLWPTREALTFGKIAYASDRPKIIAWEDETKLDEYMKTGNIKLHGPSFEEDLEGTLARERTLRPYPVLSSSMKKLMDVKDKRVFKVLLPAALTPQATIEIDEESLEEAKKSLLSATIVIVFDATGSMAEFARLTAQSIDRAFKSLSERDAEVVNNSRVGFVFYRDEKDAEKLVDMPPMPVQTAMKALLKASDKMSGGGDVAEPILDATYYATNIYEWSKSGEQAAGNRLVIAVLNGDAKVKTTGKLDDRVPVGQDRLSIVQNLREQSLKIITVQAGEAMGSNMEEIMQYLADETSGEFIRWNAGSTQKSISSALANTMTTTRKSGYEEGKKALETVKVDYDEDLATIPLNVLDAEMLERLRRDGVNFNIDPGTGGILVREGLMIENPDLLEPKIQIEKETLNHLISLYSILGTSGVDSETLRRSVAEVIAAMSGEEYDPEESIQSIIKKKLGIEFRSKLLDFNMEFLDALTPSERLEFSKRLQDAGNNLTHYLEANLKEFDTQPAVWMEIARLP